MAAFRFGEEFFGVFFVVLPSLDAEFASAVARFAAVESKRADIVFFCAGGDVGANHTTLHSPSADK